MLSRNELDLAPRFPRTYAALKKMKAKELVIDGEIVVLDEKGAPRFQLLQQGSGKRAAVRLRHSLAGRRGPAPRLTRSGASCSRKLKTAGRHCIAQTLT
jgi:hypothetical protein